MSSSDTSLEKGSKRKTSKLEDDSTHSQVPMSFRQLTYRENSEDNKPIIKKRCTVDDKDPRDGDGDISYLSLPESALSNDGRGNRIGPQYSDEISSSCGSGHTDPEINYDRLASMSSEAINKYLLLKKDFGDYELRVQEIISGLSPEVAEYTAGFIEFYESSDIRLHPLHMRLLFNQKLKRINGEI